LHWWGHQYKPLRHSGMVLCISAAVAVLRLAKPGHHRGWEVLVPMRYSA
jgi:hypothetical protein